MPRLTSQLLDNFPYSKYATAQTIPRGRAWDVSMVSDQKTTCLVDGKKGEYTGEIEIDKNIRQTDL